MGFEIDILGVGEASKGGDAITFRYGNLLGSPVEQRVIVVDGGYTKNGEELYDVITKKYKTKHIYIVILTHPDNDHVQGLKKLFEYEDIEVSNLIMHRPWKNQAVINADYTDGRITNNSIVERLKNTFNCAYELSCIAEKKKTKIIEPSVGSFNLTMNAKFNILAPSDDWYLNKILESDKTPQCEGVEAKRKLFSADDEYEYCKEGEIVKWKYDDPHTTPINETSIVALFEYDNIRILFTGDVGREGLQLAVEEANRQGVLLNNLKIFITPHHGSRKNITPELMDNIKSTFTFLSTPKNGDPHHPSRRLVNKYIEKGHKLYSTNGYGMHWGLNCPPRNGNSKDELTHFDQIEKNA